MGVKKFFSAVLGLLAYSILILCFGGTGLGVYFWLLKPPMDARKILRNGTGTTAAVISLQSKLTKGREPYYYLTLSFRNSEGEELTVETNSLYSENFIRQNKIADYNKYTGQYDIVAKDTVRVKYIGKKVILTSYTPENPDKWLWVFPIVFGLIGLVFLLAPIFIMIYSKVKKKDINNLPQYLTGNNTQD